MNVTINFHKSPPHKPDTAIVGIYLDNRLSPSAEDIDKKLDGLIRNHLKNQISFTGKKGQSLSIPVSPKTGFNRVLLMGLDSPEELDALACETIGGKLFPVLSALGTTSVAVFIDDDQARENISTTEMATHIAYGLKLRSYRFDLYKSDPEENDEKKPELETVDIIIESATKAKNLYETYAGIAEGVFLARDLLHEPPNVLYPESYARRIRDELIPLGVEIEIMDEKKMYKLGMGAALAVGMGSARPPRMVIMHWQGNKQDDKAAPLAFVGKGVTFDTGGISIKPSAAMDEMKFDMGGSAAVVGLMKSLALRKSKANVVGIVALAENMPSRDAYRPGDIVKSMSGKTIEVLNTDAEGRMVLCDALTYVQKTYKPQLIIDLATLTGAIIVALGNEYCGTYANDDGLWEQLSAASATSGEKIWRMPLDETFSKAVESKVADLRNISNIGRAAGSCTAAAFLEHFIEDDTKWAHMDIAGTAWIKKDKPTVPAPGTGFGVRVLDRFVAEHHEG